MHTKDELLNLLIEELERRGIKPIQRGVDIEGIGVIDLLAVKGSRLLLISLSPHPDEALICQLLNGFDWAHQNLKNLSLFINEVDPSEPPGVILVASHLPSKIRTALSYLLREGWEVYEYLLPDEGRVFLKRVDLETPPTKKVQGWSQEAPLTPEELKELVDPHFGTSQNLRSPPITRSTGL